MRKKRLWRCGLCPLEAEWPKTEDAFDSLMEHRLGHFADKLMGADDHALFDMSGDGPPLMTFSSPPDMIIYPVVSQEDVAPVLAGIDRLLWRNLPRARRAVQEDK